MSEEQERPAEPGEELSGRGGRSGGAGRASALDRSMARLIDFIVVLAALEALPFAGWLAGLTYILIGDALFSGQTLGKKLLGLRTVVNPGAAAASLALYEDEGPEAEETEEAGPKQRPCTIGASMLRNLTLALAVLLVKIPVLGWLLALAVVALEALVLTGSREGRRFGDELAGTGVIKAFESVKEN